MSDKLANKTQAIKDYFRDKFDIDSERILSVEDPDYSFVFCIVDGHFVIGGSNRLGEVAFETIEFTIADTESKSECVETAVDKMMGFANTGSFSDLTIDTSDDTTISIEGDLPEGMEFDGQNIRGKAKGDDNDER